MPDKTRTVPIDRGWGWMVVIGATGANGICLGIIEKLNGLFLLAFQDLFSTTVDAITWIFVINGITGAFSALIASGLGRKHGGRPIVMGGAVLGCVGLFLNSFAKRTWHVMISHGALLGLSSSIIYPQTMSLVSHYFNNKRARAVSIAATGPSVTQFVFSPLFVFLIDQYSIRGAFIILAGCFLQMLVFGALLRPLEFYTKSRLMKCTKLVSEHSQELKDLVSLKTNSSESSGRKVNVSELNELYSGQFPVVSQGVENDPNAKTDPKHVAAENQEEEELLQEAVGGNTDDVTIVCDHAKLSVEYLETSKKFKMGWSLFREPLFVLFLIGAFLAYICYLGQFLCLPIYLKEIDFDPMTAAYILSVMGISDITGRLFFGFILDLKTVKKHTYVSAWYSFWLSLTGFATILPPFMKSVPLLVCFAVIFGVAGSQVIVEVSLVLIEFIGVERLSNALGFVEVVIFVSCTIYPLVLGQIAAATGSTALFFTFTGCCGMLGGLIIGIAACLHHFKLKRKSEEQT